MSLNKKSVIYGCAVIIIVFLLIVGMVSLLLYKQYRQSESLLPEVDGKAKALFIAYNAADDKAVYNLCSKEFHSRFTPEQNKEQVIRYTSVTGPVALGNRTTWSASKINGTSTISVNYSGKCEKGNANITVQLIAEDGIWAISGYKISIK